MSIARQDTFTRANQTGWGTASDGNVWTIASGNGQSIASNEGHLASSTASTFATLGAALAGADAEGLVRFSVGDNLHNTAGIILRWTDASNHWLARFNGAAAGGAAINVMVKVGGTYTSQAGLAVTVPLNTYFWLRFRTQGTTISLKLWQDGSAEPGTWSQQFTLTQQNVAGAVGLYGYSNGTSGVNFDSFSVDDLGGSTQQGSAAFSGGGAATLDGVVLTGNTLPGSGSGAAALGAQATYRGNMAAVGGGASALTPHVVAPIGPSTLSVATSAKSWTGGPPGSPSTGTDILSTDTNGNGWWVGLIPGYGGEPVASWGDVSSGVQQTEQASRSTTISGGHIHLVEQSSGGTYAGSEGTTAGGAFTMTELAPAGTSFRRYYQGVYTDPLGIKWTATLCVYPGDPGFVVFRFDGLNTNASALALGSTDSLELAPIASLQQGDATWSPTNGGYGTVGGSNVAGWPSALTNVDPDYFYITPAAGGSSSLGIVTVKQAKSTTYTPAWTNPQVSYLQNSSRLKLKVQGVNTSWPAGVTWTAHLLRAVSPSVDATLAAAIAADYLNTTAPTMGVGTFTGFSYDERAWVVAASANQLSLTLSTPVTRYKPVLKVSGWTDTSAPALTWGGVGLVAGTDFQYTHDATNSVLYLQLTYDVVASGALSGQKNNATLNVLSSAQVGSMSASGTGTAGLVAVRIQKGSAVLSAGASASLSPVRLVSVWAQAGGSGLSVVNPQALFNAGAALSGGATANLAVGNVVVGQAAFAGGGSTALDALRRALVTLQAGGGAAARLDALRLARLLASVSGSGDAGMSSVALYSSLLAAQGSGAAYLNPDQFSPSGLPPTALVILLAALSASVSFQADPTSDATLKG